MPLTNFLTASAPAEVAASAASNILGEISSDLSIGTVASILGIALGASVALFLGWWGIRKIVRLVKGAFSKGKLSV